MTIRRFRSRLAAAALAGLAVLGWATADSVAAQEPPAGVRSPTVAILTIAEHPSLEAVRDGVVDALKIAGWTLGQDLVIDYRNAQGDPEAAARMAREMAAARPDVIVPISTPAAQAVVAATRDIPVVFAAVTDPIGAGILKNMEAPDGNVTGISDLVPVAEHIALIREILPKARRIGVLYNPAEANSRSLIDLLKLFAREQGLSVVEATAARPAEVPAAARRLVGQIDALYLTLDNTVAEVMEQVVALGREVKLPIFSADVEAVARGTIASVGFDYREMGRQAGERAAQVLRGAKTADMPAVYAEGTDLHVNPAAAAAMGVTLPASVVSVADKVVGR